MGKGQGAMVIGVYFAGPLPIAPGPATRRRGSPLPIACWPQCSNHAMSSSQQAPNPEFTRAQQMLLQFIREHEAQAEPSDSGGDQPACPICGYNLNALTRPICPECGQELALTVGVTRPRIGWLLVALAPGFFSGIAACFVLIPIMARLLVGDGKMSPALNVLDLFGFSSGLFAIVLATRPTRHRFLAQSRLRQRWHAIIIWLIHMTVFVLFVVIGTRYL
jgi:hypothetical protein